MSHFPPGYWTTACVTATVATHTGNTNWVPIPGGSTGLKMYEAGGVYLVKLSAEISTSIGAIEARVRVYDVTGAASVISAHNDQIFADDWRHVERPVSPGAGLRE
ncbi:MAG: hypothetical protein ACYS29_17275, partial [Planctomycetota bacterium]